MAVGPAGRRAVCYDRPGPAAEVLQTGEVPAPLVRAGVVVRVHSAYSLA